MRFFRRVFALFIAVLMLLSFAFAESDRSLFNQGKKAENREDYEAAYGFYKQLHDRHPEDLRYQTKLNRARFFAAATLVHKGQLLREQGKIQEALAAFQRAHEIDPSNFLAEEELKRAPSGSSPPAGGTPPAPKTSSLRKAVEEAAGPIELVKISNDTVTLKITADSKVAYQTIGKMAGLNVLFDSDYTTPRNVTLDLNKVTIEEALSVLALQSTTFWRPVTPNTIFVAADTQTKRRELEQNVLKTFYLSNASATTDFQDISNTLRTVLDIQKTQPLPNLGAIIVRGTPDQLALAQKVIDDLDKSRPEVVVDVTVMEVRRDKLKNLGITPPTANGTSGISVGLQPPNATTTTNTNNGTNTTTPTTTSNGLNLNNLGHLNATNFSVSIPPFVLNALMTDSNSKVMQNPQIRASDGQKASLKIGSRIPVATGSFQPGIGGVGINPLVNTQFTYLDVGVNIDITPTVHQNHEVSLKLLIDISSQATTVNIGGIDQPVISQDKMEQVIRLKDGEINLLGGILTEQDIVALKGIPGLSQIPFLKYFFGGESHTKADDELVFILTPHIVRDLDFSDLNEKAIFVGTTNGINMRRENKAPAAETSAPQSMNGNGAAGSGSSNATAQNATALSAPAVPGAMDAPKPAPQQNQPGGPTTLRLAPSTLAQAVGTTFTVNVDMENGQDVYAVPMQMSYNPKQLALINVSSGDFLSQGNQVVAVTHREDPLAGTIAASVTRPPGVAGVSGQGTVLTLTFKALGAGESVLAITRPGAKNSSQQTLTVLGSQASISVR